MRYIASIMTVLLFAAVSVSAQQEKAIRPLDVPMSFSGTYGELRHNHFHQGLDWRVGGRIGDPIHAIKSGFVSRVSVSVTGYGNAVYIDHPDGTTSVYGHMSSFMPALVDRVREEQYKAESFSVNLFFDPSEFPVKQGEEIGRVGNTGSSGGPHLHMEVRDTESETPLNYISHGYYDVKDKMVPVFRRIAFYAFDSTYAVPVPRRIAVVRNPLLYRNTMRLPEFSYVAVDAYDVQDGTTGKLAVEEYRVLLDGEEIFYYKVGDVGFVESPYIKSTVQAGESGADLVKTYGDPGNMLNDRIRRRDNGLVILSDYEEHLLSFEAVDEHGNTSRVGVKVRKADDVLIPKADTALVSAVCLWNMPNEVQGDGFRYSLPLGSLYNNAVVSLRKVALRDTASGIWSDVWEISSPSTALRSSGTVSISSDIPEALSSKSFVATYGRDGKLSYAGESVGFGRYCIAVDEDAPQISVDKRGNIRVSDLRSGVASVRVIIDGKWHLSKFQGSTVSILDRVSIKNGQHDVEIVACDRCSNEARYSCLMNF